MFFIFWTQENIEFLKNNYSKYSNKEIALKFNTTDSCVATMAYNLGVKKREWWSDEEIEVLKQLYSIKTNPQLSKILNRPSESIGMKARDLGLKKSLGLKYHDLDNYIEKLYLYAEELGRTPLYVETQNKDWYIPSMTLYRYIGGYREACKLAGLKLNFSLYKRKREYLYSKNNDLCWSCAEVIITNFFIDNNISYDREVRYDRFITDDRCNTKNCDWIINNNTFVEYFGMMDKNYYKIKADEKIQICKDNDIHLIALTEKDLNNLDNIFKSVFDQQNP